MDTKDQNSEISSPGVMLPDSTMLPTDPEVADLTSGATVTMAPPPGEKETKKSPTPLQDSLRRLRRDVRAMVSISIIGLFIVIALIGPPIYQHIGGTYQSAFNGTIGPGGTVLARHRRHRSRYPGSPHARNAYLPGSGHPG